MSNARAKTINLLLYEGDLRGVISIEDSSWNSGELYSAPRDSVSELIESGACSKYGVYLLLSQNMVYIGQSSDLAKRITQHTIGKDWWESVIILTTKDDSLNHSDIDYLESVLIEKAKGIGRLDCDNRTKGNPVKVDKFRKVYLGQYLEEALFLLELIGVTVFNERKISHSKKAKSESTLISTIETSTTLAAGKRAKAEAISYVKAQGISLENKISYANRQKQTDRFWLNPRPHVLDEDWNLILNDTDAKELVILRVPANTFTINQNGVGHLFLRKDAPARIDLNIRIPSLIDARSNVEFGKYVVARIKY